MKQNGCLRCTHKVEKLEQRKEVGFNLQKELKLA